jgi:TonB family protein
MPEYPYRARRRGEEGTGVFRLTIDLKTGAVHDLAVLHSTAVAELDESALTALRGWRWKPGAWKSVEVEFIFTISQPSPRPSWSDDHFPFPSSSQSDRTRSHAITHVP